MKRIAVIGSRSFDDYNLLEDSLNYFINDDNKHQTIIVSGGARGADKLAEKYASNYNIETEIFIPDWDGLGKKAGFVRNELIIEKCDMVIVFWDGQSRGSAHSIELAKKAKKPTYIIYF